MGRIERGKGGEGVAADVRLCIEYRVIKVKRRNVVVIGGFFYIPRRGMVVIHSFNFGFFYSARIVSYLFIFPSVRPSFLPTF